MRELHVIALSEDGRSVVLATTKDASSGGFRVAVDARLIAAVRGELPRPGEEAVRDSALTPKEIQSRLRAGESPEKIAAEAGVPVARVERFAGPVASEFQLTITQAQAGFVIRGRRGRSILPLGSAVEQHLAATPSLRPESVLWTTRREDEGTWWVQVGYVARARQRTAAWRYDPKQRSVTPVDAESAAFGHIEDETTAHARAARTAKRMVAKQVSTSSPRPLSSAMKSRTAKATSRKVQPGGSAATGEAATKVPATEPPAATVTVAKPTAAKPTAAKATATRPPATKAPATKAPAAKAPAGRPSVPAWADVLLGTAPRPDPGTGD